LTGVPSAMPLPTRPIKRRDGTADSQSALSRRAGFDHEALPLADHAHHLKAFDGRRSGRQRLETARRIYQPPQRAVICL